MATGFTKHTSAHQSRSHGYFSPLLNHLLARFRHPISLPSDIGQDLGIFLPNHLTFKGCIETLSSNPLPKNLHRLLSREETDAIFSHARRHDSFLHSSIFSYCFDQKWIEIQLIYDQSSKLRRVCFQYQGNLSDQPIEIPIRNS